MVIGLIAVTASGRARAARLAGAWSGQTRIFDGPARQTVPAAWAQCDALVCFLAVGATVRLIAPLLDSKWTDPAVVCVDESARHAVAVVGGHVAGANALARRVAAVLAAEPVITTATGVLGLPGLDVLGWPAEGAIGMVSRAMLDGQPVRLEAESNWPLPPLPDSVGRPEGDFRILITDRIVPLDGKTVILRPPSLIVGVAKRRQLSAAEVLRLIGGALTHAALSPSCVTAIACPASQADDPEIESVAQQRGWRVAASPGAADVGGAAPDAAVIAKAAANASGVQLAAFWRAPASASAAVAVARIQPRGRLALVTIGSGARDLLAPRVVSELRRAAVVIGLENDVAAIADLIRPGALVLATAAEGEDSRIEQAVEQAREGKAVALVSPEEAAVFAARRAVAGAGAAIEVVAVPGITASQAAAAAVGGRTATP